MQVAGISFMGVSDVLSLMSLRYLKLLNCLKVGFSPVWGVLLIILILNLTLPKGQTKS